MSAMILCQHPGCGRWAEHFYVCLEETTDVLDTARTFRVLDPSHAHCEEHAHIGEPCPEHPEADSWKW